MLRKKAGDSSIFPGGQGTPIVATIVHDEKIARQHAPLIIKLKQADDSIIFITYQGLKQLIFWAERASGQK